MTNKRALEDYAAHLKNKTETISNAHLKNLPYSYSICLDPNYIHIKVVQNGTQQTYTLTLSTGELKRNQSIQPISVLAEFETIYKKIMNHIETHPQQYKRSIQ